MACLPVSYSRLVCIRLQPKTDENEWWEWRNAVWLQSRLKFCTHRGSGVSPGAGSETDSNCCTSSTRSFRRNHLHRPTTVTLVTIMTTTTTAGLACDRWPRKPLGVIIIMALLVPLRKWPMMVPAMYDPCNVWIQIQNNNYENNYSKFL